MNNLEFLRRNQGITQTDLAARLGIDASILSRCERGWFARPPSGLEEKLQAYFGPEWTFEKLMAPVPDLTAEAATPNGNSHGSGSVGNEPAATRG